MSDKPKKRITGESVANEGEWDVLIDIEYSAYLCPSIKDLVRRARAAAHREGWDAAIQVAALKVCDLLMPGPHGPWLRDNLRALPYPGIAKAEGGSDGE